MVWIAVSVSILSEMSRAMIKKCLISLISTTMAETSIVFETPSLVLSVSSELRATPFFRSFETSSARLGGSAHRPISREVFPMNSFLW
ncbi:MAG: hypothetical protein ACD_47C00335G0001 [uncultured bacterium]|nr:MAG: hypothetical protein ACD_47C00335G0001 [uncultured bacterium]